MTNEQPSTNQAEGDSMIRKSRSGRGLLGGLAAVRTRRGSAMVMAVVFTAVVGSTVSYVMLASNHQTRNTFRARLMDTSLSAAATVVSNMSQQAYFLATTRPAQMGGNWNNMNDIITSIKPEKLPGYVSAKHSDGRSLTYMAAGDDNGEYSTIDDPLDDWHGFKIRRWTYDAVAFMNEADAEDADSVSPVAQRLGFEGAGFKARVQVNYIPLYHYAIFYDNDLEFHPGPAMEVLGPVHTNRNLWLGAGNSLKLNSRVSSAGNVRSYRDFRGAVSGTQLAPVNYKVSSSNVWLPENSDHTGIVSIVKDGQAIPINQYDGYSGSDISKVDSNKNRMLDGLDANWMENALDRFKGQLSDKAMGDRPIKPPLPYIGSGKDRRQADASELIQRATPNGGNPDLESAKIENAADIRIIADPSKVDKDGNLTNLRIEVSQLVDGKVQSWNGGTIPNQLTDAQGKPTGEPLVKLGKFRDYRENRDVQTLDVNMGEMLKRSDVVSKLTAGNRNGVLYVSTEGNNDPAYDPTSANNASQRDNHKMNAVRIRNAKAVPAKVGDNTLTIATDRPMYVEGDVNVGAGDTPKATLLLAADALTVTSQELNESSGRRPKAARATETNAILMLGQVSSKYQTIDPATGMLVGNAKDDTIDHFAEGYGRKQWSGGVHNVIRYLEDWSGVKHKYTGSLICLFESRVATHRHETQPDGDTKYYDAPNRDYSWDTSLKDKVPPAGMPVLVQVRISPMQRISKDQAVALLD